MQAVTTGEQDLNKEENGKKGTKGEKERVRRGKRKERNNDKSLAADFTTEIDSRLLSALLTVCEYSSNPHLCIVIHCLV